MFEFKACTVLITNEFAWINDCFQNKHNAEIGHYIQALITDFCKTTVKSFFII